MFSRNILAIGDCHFKSTSLNLKRSDIMTKKIISLIKRKNEEIDFIVMLGDTLHTHETVNIEAYTRAVQFLQDLSKLKHVYLLIGNHDLKNNQQFCSKVHAFNSLKNWENLTVIDEPAIIDGFTFCPYVATGRFHEALNRVDYKNTKIVFAHQEIRGTKMGDVISTKGDIWNLEEPLLISGHIHEYSVKDNVIYVGTPMQQSFGESSDKALMLISVKDDNITRKRIKLNIPELLNLYSDCDELDSLEIENPSYNIKLHITGTSNQIILAKKSKKIKYLEKSGVSINYKTENETVMREYKPVKLFRDVLYESMDTKEKKDLFNELFFELIN